MKTSLNILRATNACTGGFGRQASFWTVRPKAKAIEYPIWMIGLTGTYDDLNWAIQNSLVVDEADFKELKTRTFWPMFQYLFWNAIDEHFILKHASKKAGDFQRDALQGALKVRNVEDAQAWMDTYSRYKFCTPLFAQVANNSCWTNPQDYLSTLTHAILVDKSSLCLQHEHLPFDLNAHLPGHDSRTMKSKKSSSRSRPPAPRYRDEEDDEEPNDRNTKTAETPYFDMPQRANGRIITKGEQFAYVCLNRDPWPVALQFLMDNNVPALIGSKMLLSKVSEDGKEPEQFHASLNLSDPRTIFTLMHLLQGQDFDIFKAMHIEQKLNRLVRVLRDEARDDSMDTLDSVVDDPQRIAQARIVEGQKQAAITIAEQGPSGGAIRERVINTSPSGVDRFADDGDGDEGAPVVRRVRRPAEQVISGSRDDDEDESEDDEQAY